MNCEYLRPATVKEACETLFIRGSDARLIAGGTDLFVQFHENDERWRELKLLVDISALRELRFIRENGDSIEIGALTTHDELDRSSLLRSRAAFLSDAAGTVGSRQIRNLGTIAGCVANASAAADPLPPLIALDARAVIAGPDWEREVLLRDLYVKPGLLALEPGEMIVRFVFDKLAEDSKTAFLKLGRRKALAISRMNVAAAITVRNGVIREARVCPGCLFPTPGRVTAAEELLIGKAPEKTHFDQAGREVAAEMIRRTGVRWSAEYKEPVAAALVSRTLQRAMGEER